MRRTWVVVVFLGSVVLGLGPRVVRGQAHDAEHLLAGPLSFSAAEMDQARDGRVVVKSYPGPRSDLVVFGTVRIPDNKDRLVRWVKDVEGMRKAAGLGLAHKLSSPPTIQDFDGLSLDPSDLAALQKCRPGDCELRLSDRGIARAQELDWTSPDASRLANIAARQLAFEYIEAYLRGGDEALGAAHDRRKPRLVADEFRALIRNAVYTRAIAPELAKYLEQYPKVTLSGVEEFFYWAKVSIGPEPSYTLNHTVIYRDKFDNVQIADKQLYASRYVDAALFVRWLGTSPDGEGYYLLSGMRAQSTLLEGFVARMLRGRLEANTRTSTQNHLEFLRKSLGPK